MCWWLAKVCQAERGLLLLVWQNAFKNNQRFLPGRYTSTYSGVACDVVILRTLPHSQTLSPLETFQNIVVSTQAPASLQRDGAVSSVALPGILEGVHQIVLNPAAAAKRHVRCHLTAAMHERSLHHHTQLGDDSA